MLAKVTILPATAHQMSSTSPPTRNRIYSQWTVRRLPLYTGRLPSRLLSGWVVRCWADAKEILLDHILLMATGTLSLNSVKPISLKLKPNCVEVYSDGSCETLLQQNAVGIIECESPDIKWQFHNASPIEINKTFFFLPQYEHERNFRNYTTFSIHVIHPDC